MQMRLNKQSQSQKKIEPISNYKLFKWSQALLKSPLEQDTCEKVLFLSCDSEIYLLSVVEWHKVCAVSGAGAGADTWQISFISPPQFSSSPPVQPCPGAINDQTACLSHFLGGFKDILIC